jgi:sirohydrochlorin ferrochelatase
VSETRPGILLVDHGSRREESNQQLEDMAQRVAALVPGSVVRAAHMEIAEPTIEQGIDALAEAGCRAVTVLLYFLSDGRHVTRDVPALIEAATDRHDGMTWRIGEALGPHDDLARLLLKRAGLSDATGADPGS